MDAVSLSEQYAKRLREQQRVIEKREHLRLRSRYILYTPPSYRYSRGGGSELRKNEYGATCSGERSTTGYEGRLPRGEKPTGRTVGLPAMPDLTRTRTRIRYDGTRDREDTTITVAKAYVGVTTTGYGSQMR